MEHIGKIIHDPRAYADKITHEDSIEQKRRRDQFIERHAFRHHGAAGITFSVICCDNPKHVERHTIGALDEMTDEEFITMLAHHATQHAIAHEKSSAKVELLKTLTDDQLMCGCCGGKK